MLFYIDYLDYITSGSRSFKELALRLRFDLLIFGHDTLCMSVPACIKMRDTTGLLMELDEFWKNGKIRLQLDKKHKGNPQNYFRNRKKVLAKAMPEERLVKHFEFIAYESNRTNIFFGSYLPDTLSKSDSNVYIGKENDTDKLFRQDTTYLLERHYDPVCRILGANRAITFTGIVNRIHECALNQSSLYQRALIEEIVVDEFNPTFNERLIVSSLLDRAFALANAGTSNAVPISLVLNQLTGIWLKRLLFRSYGELYNLICKLSWSEVYVLSQSSDWREFIGYINAFIYLIQDSRIKKYPIDIRESTSKLSKSISLLNLLRFVGEEAISAAKDKLYEYGLFSEAQNLEVTIDLLLSCYAGRHKQLLDAMCAIDILAKRITENMTKLKNFDYLLGLNNKKDYIILK